MTQQRKMGWARIAFCGLLAASAAGAIYLHLKPLPARPALFSKDNPEDIVSAIKALSDDDLKALKSVEAERFVAAPLDSNALEDLLLISNVRGDAADSAALIKLTADRSLRNYPAQLAAIQQSLASKNYGDVFYRLDGLIRTQTDQKAEFFAMITSMLGDEEAGKSLGKLLAESPPWRGEFLREALGKTLDSESAFRLLSSLKQTQSPPTPEELRVLINRLLTDGKTDTAYFVWLDFLNEVELRKVKMIFDGGFELDPKNRFFDWTIGQQEGSQASLADRSVGSADRVLRVQFAGSSGFYSQVQQMTRLTPGGYQFRGQEKAQDLATSGGLSWALYCFGTNQLLAKTKPMLTDMDWSGFEISFDVPPTNCGTQFLRLESASRTELDMKISGTLYFDDLEIENRGASTTGNQGQ